MCDIQERRLSLFLSHLFYLRNPQLSFPQKFQLCSSVSLFYKYVTYKCFHNIRKIISLIVRNTKNIGHCPSTIFLRLFVAEDIFEISASRPCSANSSLLLLRILLSYNEFQKSQNPLCSGGDSSPMPSVHNGRSFLVAIFRYPFFSACYRGVSVAPMLRGLSKLQFSPTRCAVVGIAPNNPYEFNGWLQTIQILSAHYIPM